MTRVIRVVVVLLLVAGLATSLSCTKPQAKAPKEPGAAKPEATPESAQDTGDGAAVLMMGRSVMYGWFKHWEEDPSQPVERNGFTLRYVEIATPPDIAGSVAEKTAAIKNKNTVVFFKFCFDDFAGGSSQESAASLAEKQRYTQQVYDSVVKERGLRLVIGNALPKVKSAGDPWLVANHRKFNAWLDEFAERHDSEVTIFDEYGILSDGEGNLKAEYASSPDDSHPNEAGYKALDPRLDEILDTLR